MKLSNQFIAYQAQDQTVLVAVGGAAFSGLIRGNEALGELLSLLKEETAEADLIAAMRERYDAPDGAIEKAVHDALEQLRAVGALEE